MALDWLVNGVIRADGGLLHEPLFRDFFGKIFCFFEKERACNGSPEVFMGFGIMATIDGAH